MVACLTFLHGYIFFPTTTFLARFFQNCQSPFFFHHAAGLYKVGWVSKPKSAVNYLLLGLLTEVVACLALFHCYIVLHTSMLEPSGDLCSRTQAISAPCSSPLERTRADPSGLGMLKNHRAPHHFCAYPLPQNAHPKLISCPTKRLHVSS